MGLPLLFEGSPTVGFGLYGSAMGQNVGDYGTLLVGIVIYAATVMKLRRDRGAVGRE